jgi:hypothetical protein
MPAEAGIQVTVVRVRVRLDSRVRGNDVWGWARRSIEERHARGGGHPGHSGSRVRVRLDSRVRGNDVWGWARR